MKKSTGYLFKRGRRWLVQYNVEVDGQRKRTNNTLMNPDGTPCRTRKEAEDARATLLQPLALKDQVATLEALAGRIDGRKAELARIEAERNPGATIAQAWSLYRATPGQGNRSDRTRNEYEAQFSRFAEWMAEHFPAVRHLRAVTPEHATAFAAALEKEASARTVGKYLTLLQHVFEILRGPGRIAENPWTKRHVARPKLKGRQVQRRPLTRAELKTLIESAPGELRTMLSVGTFCGLRMGDAALLDWGEVDLSRGIVELTPRKTATTSGARVRVGIPAYLRAELEKTPPAARRGHVMPGIAEAYQRDQAKLVEQIRQHFEACGITTRKDAGEHRRAGSVAGFHALRYTYVSMQAEAGTPRAAVEAAVGHSSQVMTAHYEKLSDDALVRFASALPVTLEDKPALPAPAPVDWRAEVRRIAAGLNAKSWKTAAAKLVALAGR